MTEIATSGTSADATLDGRHDGRTRVANAGVYARLKAVVFLSGAVRPSALMDGIRRSLFDLPLNNMEKLLDRWVGEARGLSESRGITGLELKMMLDARSELPRVRSETQGVKVERDPFEYRGTGGVLHDVTRALGDDDYLLVVSGARLLGEPLSELVDALAERGGDVGILGHRDGTPSGLMLIRCGALREISDMGFVDLKEQALPAIARQHRVTVERRETLSFPVRTVRDYLSALRHDHRRQRGESISPDPFAEDWQAEFSVVEEGARVHESARLLDSVVLANGVVGANAVLVRSIVCGGAVIRSGERRVDELIRR